MKHLRVEVNGTEWVNGDFAEISFTDGPGGVRIEGKTARSASTGAGPGLLEILTGASKARTEAIVEEKRAALAAETTEIVEADPVI